MAKTRGKGYPKLSLTGALTVVKKAYSIKGSMSKETFAGFGANSSGKASINSGAFLNKIAALRSYGLITTDKDSVTLTPLAVKVCDPVDDNEKAEALLECFFNVEVFRDLYEGLQKERPLERFVLESQAIHEIEISRAGRTHFVNNFIDAGQLVGLINVNGTDIIISDQNSVDQDCEEKKVEEKTDEPKEEVVAENILRQKMKKDREHLVSHEWKGDENDWSIELTISTEKLPSDFYEKIANIMGSIESLKHTFDLYEE